MTRKRTVAKKLAHASERAAERMGVAVDIADLNGMVAKIEAGGANRLRDRCNGGQHYLVTWQGKAFRVVYEPQAKIILTVLEPIAKMGVRRR